MSVTFQLDRDNGLTSPFSGQGEPTDAEVDAYFDARAALGEFNVANGNAGYILRDILGLSGDFEDICYGQMDADRLGLQLSLVDPLSTVGGMIPASQEGNVIDCGRSLSQCERYVQSLIKLCSLAEGFGCGIRWG